MVDTKLPANTNQASPIRLGFLRLALIFLLSFAFIASLAIAACVSDMGPQFLLAKGMAREKVSRVYGKPDKETQDVLTYFQGGHDVELKFKQNVVIEVQVILCD